MKTQNSLVYSSIIAVVLLSGVFAFSQLSNQDSQIQNDGFMIIGHVTWTVYDEFGNVKSYSQQDNLIVNEGIYTTVDLMFPDINLNGNATDAEFSFIRIGTGSTAPALADTGIETPVVGCGAVQDTSVEGVTASGSATITINATFTGASGCVGTFAESVLANSATGGEILARQLISPAKVVGAADTLVGTWDITVT